MKRNQVILLYGMPASGKYTMAKLLQEQNGGVLLDNHYFHDMFHNIIHVPENRRSEYSAKIDTLRKDFLDIIESFPHNKKFTRFIFTSFLSKNDEFPVMLEKFAHDINADFILIGLSASDDVLMSRCNTEYRKSREKLSDPEKYLECLPNLHSKTFVCTYENNFNLNTDNLSEQETFIRIVNFLKRFD